MMTVDLTGKIALITNVGVYMGAPVARAFAQAGAGLALHATTEAALAELERTLPVADCVVWRAAGDISDSACADAYVDAIVGEAGALDILVNNNGIPIQLKSVTDLTDDEWWELSTQLLDAVVFTTRAALRHMMPRDQGKIVNITSAAPLDGLPLAAAYSAVRGGANAFTKAVGAEVARFNIQVNAIAQNYVENPTYYPPSVTDNERFQEHLRRNVPAQRLGTPEETAELALFLASDASDFICGQVIPFAGGWAR